MDIPSIRVANGGHLDFACFSYGTAPQVGMEKRARRVAEKPGHRICYRCESELAATPEVFIRDSTRPLGLAYECRACHSQRKRGRDRRPERWANSAPEEKERRKARYRRYYAAGPGKALYLFHAYRSFDAKRGLATDISAQWIRENVLRAACSYCGTTEETLGCDRLDNAVGHTVDNIVPACGTCNRVRGDRFTSAEMAIIGAAIATVRSARAHG
jgi:hypothetical protein